MLVKLKTTENNLANCIIGTSVDKYIQIFSHFCCLCRFQITVVEAKQTLYL